jgi:hypothetical protein
MVHKPLAALALLVAGATPACAFISPLSNGGYIACSPLAVFICAFPLVDCAAHGAPHCARGKGFMRNSMIPALVCSAVPQSAAAIRGTAAASASPKLRRAQLPSVCALKASSKASSVCVRAHDALAGSTNVRTHTRTLTHHLGSSNGERRENWKRGRRHHALTHHTHTHTHTYTPRSCEAKQEAEEKKSGANGMTKAKDENTAIFTTPGGTPGATPPKVPKP